MDWTRLTIHETLSALGRGTVTAGALVEAYLARLQALNPALGAYLCVAGDAARAQAAASDERIRRGEPLLPLEGVPLAIKDVLCTRGVTTTCGSKVLANFVPPYDATVMVRLAADGAIMLGKTNMDEFAMGSSTENSGFHPARNPWALDRVPGGSSGGSAAAVAADLAAGALGTDTGGSVRQPAALCGVVGLKPTYGRVSRYGLVAFASSLDQIGPITKDVRDAALLLEAIAGHDPMDSTSADYPVPDYQAALDQGVRGLTLGIPDEYFIPGLDAEVEAAVREAIAAIERLGARTRRVSLPHTDYGVAAYYILAPAEASSNLARYDGVKYGYRAAGAKDLVAMTARSRVGGFGAEVKRRIMLGTYALSAGYYEAYYGRAQRVRTLIRRDFDRALGEVDVIVAPTSPTPAFKLGEKTEDPLAMYLNDVFTIPASVAGLPGISVPCGFSASGLPIGLQLIGKPFDEAILLRVAAAYEAATEWHTRRPSLEVAG
ncbi:MAG: Asp-tRNA(Asn)/Glu-tRNA(Gln) amidotransferase subunit GatA [Candidatus Rokubacteria bacterium]|nr:Asp-tRNA(Asn)/Glu-tRNA(Gln) amidotransferase subunit GatA [Candidatus Rokubacteria bacterium]